MGNFQQKWTLIYRTSSLLSEQFDRVRLDFLRVLYGLESLPQRSKRCLNRSNSVLGMLIARYFVTEAFSSASKRTAIEMLQFIQNAFNSTLTQIDWLLSFNHFDPFDACPLTDSVGLMDQRMDSATRAAAKRKLKLMNDKIGYPDVWPSYAALKLADGDYFGNVLSCWRFDFDRNIASAGALVDKQQWEMNPQEVNAYYDPLLNEMVFPLSILSTSLASID